MLPAPRDQLRRPLRDLRVSVTDRCNFRCPYCMPAEVFGRDHAFLKDPQLMTRQELERLLGVFVGLGVQKLRFTGGEPLMRADVPDLIAFAKHTLRVPDVALTTNGWFLERHVPALREAGLDRLNVSLDSFDEGTFGRMNGVGLKPGRVLSAIAAAKDAGFSLKTNMVVQRGVNEQEIEAMAAWGREQGITPRFVEFMDVGNHNGWVLDRVVPAREVVGRIAARWPVEAVTPAYRGEVASRYRYLDGRGEFGIISSITEPFCADCNRARLSADGKLFTCLFSRLGKDVLGVLRGGAGDAEIAADLGRHWGLRADRYSDERAEKLARGEVVEKIEMSYIGG